MVVLVEGQQPGVMRVVNPYVVGQMQRPMQPIPMPTQQREGYGFGYDVKALAAWAKTPEGQAYGRRLAQPQGYGFSYDVRDLAAFAKSPAGQKYSQELAQWKRTNLIGQVGIDYDTRDIATAAKYHPEWFVISEPQPQPKPQSRMLPGGMRRFFEGVEREERETMINQAYARIGWTPEAASKLADQITRKETMFEGFKRTWSEPGLRPENIASSLILRNLWDVGYRKQLEAEYKDWEKAQGGPQAVADIRRAQEAQVQFGVSVGLIAYTAYDIGRNIYNVARNWQAIKEPSFTIETPAEEAVKPMQVIRMTGPKGERGAEYADISPIEKPVANPFEITPTRGSWSKAPIMKDTKASTTLTDLFLAPSLLPTLTSTNVPFASYEPFLLTEMFASGAAVGQIIGMPKQTHVNIPQVTIPKIPKVTFNEPTMTEPQMNIPKFTMPNIPKFSEPMMNIPKVTAPTMSIPRLFKSELPSQSSFSFTMPRFKDVTDTATMPIQEVAQMQKQAQSQIQRQMQQQLSTQRYSQRMYEDFYRMPKRRGSQNPFDFSGRVKRFYPIKSAREVIGL